MQSSSASTDGCRTDPSPSRRSARFVNVAPLNTPLKHRLETLGVLIHCMTLPFFVCLFLITLSLGWVVWVLVLVPYFVWWYGFDLHTPTNGKVVYRARNWLKNIILFQWFASYFPIRVHKLCDLEPTFSEVPIDSDHSSDDEEDLILETSRTAIDMVFKKLGLSKRLNTESFSPPPSESSCSSDSADESGSDIGTAKSKMHRSFAQKYTRVTTGPRYIFGYHPHGVISMGVMGFFATNAVRNEPFEPPLSWLKPLFHDPSKGVRALPGISNIFPLTLTTQFAIPFYREYILALGVTSASAKNIKSLINNGDNSVCIVVGGAQESLLNSIVTDRTTVGYGFKGENPDHNHTRQIRLVLKRRKGFVKIAIELGNVSLVPTFAFGEADIYRLNTPQPGSWGNTLQCWLKEQFKFTLPFFSARGIFIYDWGILPFRHPIDICMGNPIHIPHNAVEAYYAQHPHDIPNELENEDFNKTEDENKADPHLDTSLRHRGKNGQESVAIDATTQESSSPSLIGRTSRGILTTKSLTGLFGASTRKSISIAQRTKKIPPEIVDYYHGLYIAELQRVYETNKEEYGYGNVELVIED